MAHYALQKLRILPSVFCEMDQKEKAFIIGSIEKRVEAEQEERENAKNPNKGRKRRRKR